MDELLAIPPPDRPETRQLTVVMHRRTAAPVVLSVSVNSRSTAAPARRRKVDIWDDMSTTYRASLLTAFATRELS